MNQAKKKVLQILFNYIFIYVKPKPKIAVVLSFIGNSKPLLTPFPSLSYVFAPLPAPSNVVAVLEDGSIEGLEREETPDEKVEIEDKKEIV